MPEEKKTEAVTEETENTAAEDTAESEIKEELKEEAAPEAEEPKEAEGEKTEEAEAPEEETAEEPEETGEEGAEGKGRRFWQKQAKPQKKDKKDQLIEELNDKLARQLAEFENFRKRTDKEKLQNYTVRQGCPGKDPAGAGQFRERPGECGSVRSLCGWNG